MNKIVVPPAVGGRPDVFGSKSARLRNFHVRVVQKRGQAQLSVTSDLDRRWGIDVFEGVDGQSIYDAWGSDIRTLHGMMTHGFPNQFFIGLYQGGLNATIPETFNRQTEHVAYMIQQALQRAATRLEPTLEAQDAWVDHLRSTAFDISQLQRECTPSYLNNEGDASKGQRWYLGETYGPGWGAFQELLRNWRERRRLSGLNVE